jgi:hypothetical protein
LQAVFYVFCFRLGDIVQSPDGYEFLRSLKLDTIIKCRHQPLQVCAKHVAKEFARVTKKHQILYCTQYTRRRSVIAFPKIGYVSAADLTTTHQPLADFFPFDPYKLRLSKHFVDGTAHSCPANRKCG